MNRIVLAGACNSGKSALLNAICGQQAAIVSPLAGTTTDPVARAIELPGAGPCVIVDTPGLDDSGTLGSDRTGRTRFELERADMVVALLEPDRPGWSDSLLRTVRELGVPVITVVPRCDIAPGAPCPEGAIAVSALTGEGVDRLIAAIVRTAVDEGLTDAGPSLTEAVAAPGSTVLLVMPQDSAAPQGRLILPQSLAIRDLLGRGCTAICTTPGRIASTLASLSRLPDLVITDSQAFAATAAAIPPQLPLTSFSLLMAAYKADLPTLLRGAEAIDRLTGSSRVLIAEACTHAPVSEDIGRVKIPAMLRRRFGDTLAVDIVAGTDYPDDLTPYDLVIHCGGCMFTRRHVMQRIRRATRAGVPVTNYGILLARLTGQLQRCVMPGAMRNA